MINGRILTTFFVRFSAQEFVNNLDRKSILNCKIFYHFENVFWDSLLSGCLVSDYWLIVPSDGRQPSEKLTSLTGFDKTERGLEWRLKDGSQHKYQEAGPWLVKQSAPSIHEMSQLWLIY